MPHRGETCTTISTTYLRIYAVLAALLLVVVIACMACIVRRLGRTHPTEGCAHETTEDTPESGARETTEDTERACTHETTDTERACAKPATNDVSWSGQWLVRSPITIDDTGKSSYLSLPAACSDTPCPSWVHATPVVYISCTSHFSIPPSRASQRRIPQRVHITAGAVLCLHATECRSGDATSLDFSVVTLGKGSSVCFLPLCPVDTGDAPWSIFVRFHHSVQAIAVDRDESRSYQEAAYFLGASTVRAYRHPSATPTGCWMATSVDDSLLLQILEQKRSLQSRVVVLEATLEATLEAARETDDCARVQQLTLELATLRASLESLQKDLDSRFSVSQVVSTIGWSIYDLLDDSVDTTDLWGEHTACV